MTVTKRTKRPKPNAELMQLADSMLVNYKKPEDLIGKNGLLKQLTKMLVERALERSLQLIRLENLLKLVNDFLCRVVRSGRCRGPHRRIDPVTDRSDPC